MRGPNMTERYMEMIEKIERDIASDKKCSVMGVFGDEETPPFAYTIGLTDLGWPELILAGVEGVIGVKILNTLVERCSTDLGMPVAGMSVKYVVADFPVRLETISDAQRDEYLRWAIARQERVGGPEPKALQVVFPDPEGRWPDDPECEAKTAFVQQLPTEEQRERVQ